MRKLNILILGGGVFLGAAALQSVVSRGHAVTVFNRGRSRSAWPAGVAALTGDRASDLGALQGGHWDAVIDTCGYVPADVQASAEALSGCGCYLFISSISVYATTTQVPVRETDTLARFDTLARDDRNLEHYGPQKAACEAEVQQAFGDRALIVRPGLIVGPGDRSGRFSHWPWRALAGGDMVVPDVPPREPLQFIDVRDLGEWMVRLLEDNTRGVFNATGPVNDDDAPVCDWRALLQTCTDAVAARGLVPARGMPVAEPFLVEQGVQPWSELPLWLPSGDPEYAGFNRVDLRRARAAGLRTRALRDTVEAVLDEGPPVPDDKRRAGKLARDKEAQLLAAWAAASVGH
ncbi:MAG: NAD-dependent epimerase/dehydratase family protein [Burkholderiales bacterium]|nr:NAD-dependent epimerase/dehydratase family protein [Burkholderiales bacterium]